MVVYEFMSNGSLASLLYGKFKIFSSLITSMFIGVRAPRIVRYSTKKYVQFSPSLIKFYNQLK